MPTPTFQPPQGQQSTAQLQDWIIKLVRDLNYLLENLDTVNINRLDAKVIIAQTITALQIAANTITADKLSVTQLSAITADMGTLNAGSITTNAQINIGTDATVGRNLYLGTSTSDSKLVLNGGSSLETNYGAGSINVKSSSQVSLTSTGNVTMQASGNVVVISAGGVIADLVGAINYLNAHVITSGLSGLYTYYVSDTLGGAATRKLTFTDGILTSQT